LFWVVAALGAAAALVLSLTVDLSGRSVPNGPRETTVVAGRSPLVVGRSPLVDQPAPPIDLRDLEGRRVRLADFDGRPVIVNFWASWCIPCREEFQLFREARAAHAEEGLEILGIVHDDSAANAAEFVAQEAAEWPALMDPDDVAWAAYLNPALPTTFFIDREGIVRAVSYGPPPADVLEDHLARIF